MSYITQSFIDERWWLSYVLVEITFHPGYLDTIIFFGVHSSLRLTPFPNSANFLHPISNNVTPLAISLTSLIHELPTPLHYITQLQGTSNPAGLVPLVQHQPSSYHSLHNRTTRNIEPRTRLARPSANPHAISDLLNDPRCGGIIVAFQIAPGTRAWGCP